MEKLPQEIIFEIMQRIPLKYVLKCTSVSKELKNIIDSYLMIRPRVLFSFDSKSPDMASDMLLHSFDQENDPWLSSGPHRTRISSKHKYFIRSGPLRGLFCLQSYTEVVLCNPRTEKLLILPESEAHEGYTARNCFLGYDKGKDVLKVLLSVSVLRDKTMQMYNRVLTVGPGEMYWRPIECEQCYLVVTNGLCIEGILYYGAWSRGERSRNALKNRLVMSFKVRSEEFTVIELPKGVKVGLSTAAKLVNYNGEVCLVIHGSEKDLDGSREFLIHVRDESAGKWREVRVVIPRWRAIAGDWSFSLEGTIETGELVFATNSFLYGSYFVLYYDTITQILRKLKIPGLDGGSYQFAKTYLNHFDSLLLT